MAHSPHRSYRGCPMCKPNKRRGAGRASKEDSGRDPARVNRKLGRARRGTRRDIPKDQQV